MTGGKNAGARFDRRCAVDSRCALTRPSQCVARLRNRA
ncbi:hypothetical protein BURMUCGD2_4328 [Burkholderia multivorans CGD2]|uniref:Uncharacterized protein n=1 Tax=Burkholderia multivorans CGD2 TaxID=513052 RepID=B9BGV9_9BURK|nr:hypothetical protein BURMUCGD2_4328 [Burkholderia multivorans CGD2]